MKVDELRGWIGEWEITMSRQGKVVEKDRIKNMITNAGLNMLRDSLNGAISDCEIKYIALGDSDLAVTASQIKLSEEKFRKIFVSKTSPSIGVSTHRFEISDTEALFHIKEIAIFAGVTATETKDSGIMVSRILWERERSIEIPETIAFNRIDSIDRG